jgi:hypothetical protein
MRARKPILPDALTLLAEEAHQAGILLAQAECERAYRLALLAAAASASEAEQPRAFEACARSAGVSRQTLQDFVLLSTRWGPTKVAGLMGTSDRSGRRLTKASLLRIARAPSALRQAFNRALEAGDVDLDDIFSCRSLRTAPGPSETHPPAENTNTIVVSAPPRGE